VVYSKSRPTEDFDIIVTNYERLKDISTWIMEKNPKAIVFDESHYLKNYKAIRTKAATALAKNIEYRFLLSGTPMLNRPKELISQLTILDTLKDFGGFNGFINRYCDPKRTRYGLDIDGANNLEELKINLRKVCMVRREKTEVLSELPEKQRTYIPINIDNRAEYNKAVSDLIGYLKEKYPKKKDITKVLQAETLVKINTLRQIVANGKIAEFSEWLDNFLQSQKKLVVFVQHKAILERLEGVLRRLDVKGVSLCGDDSIEARQMAINAFQNDPAIRVIICTLKAGGVGVTLTAASDVAFLETGWTPAELDQAEDRCHRIGQKNAVNCWYFRAHRSVDDMLFDLIEKKRGIVELDDKEVISEFVKSLLG
jgi:SWI/SNF-related matrix-associated actin-dependent regulator 1 of chromatin subfamily A